MKTTMILTVLLTAILFQLEQAVVCATPASKKDVQMLTKEPERSYEQIEIVEATCRGRSGYSHCLKEIQEKAFKLGADAIILLDGKQGEKSVGVVNGQLFTKRSKSSATGIAIRFLRAAEQ